MADPRLQALVGKRVAAWSRRRDQHRGCRRCAVADFAVRREYSSPGFGGAAKTSVEMVVVQADSVEEAREFAISRSSVLSIHAGLDLSIVEIDWSGAEHSHTTYEGDTPRWQDDRLPAGARVTRVSRG